MITITKIDVLHTTKNNDKDDNLMIKGYHNIMKMMVLRTLIKMMKKS